MSGHRISSKVEPHNKEYNYGKSLDIATRSMIVMVSTKKIYTRGCYDSFPYGPIKRNPSRCSKWSGSVTIQTSVSQASSSVHV